MIKLIDFCLNKSEKLQAKVQAFLAKEDELYYKNKKAYARRQGYFFMWISFIICSVVILAVLVGALWNR